VARLAPAIAKPRCGPPEADDDELEDVGAWAEPELEEDEPLGLELACEAPSFATPGLLPEPHAASARASPQTPTAAPTARMARWRLRGLAAVVIGGMTVAFRVGLADAANR
jgi:hypothetical protein